LSGVTENLFLVILPRKFIDVWRKYQTISPLKSCIFADQADARNEPSKPNKHNPLFVTQRANMVTYGAVLSGEKDFPFFVDWGCCDP